jgi:hypothetical protein
MAGDTRITDNRSVMPLSALPSHPRSHVQSVARPALAVVEARFLLVQPDEPAPAEWQTALSALTDWLGLAVDCMPESQLRGIGKMARWAKPGAVAKRSAPVFAPWQAWSPAAFQLGGVAGLPQADWAVSYLVDPGAGLGGAAARGIDLALMSPLPSACLAEDAGSMPLPRSQVLRAMLRLAKDQCRARVAIICHARQRNAIARQLLVADRALTREGQMIDIITIEDALRPLISGAAPWDAVIAMPDVRSIVFTLLAETTGVHGPWPILWRSEAGTQGPLLVTSEVAGEGQSRIALDAPVLAQALALTCQSAGIHQAARRLYREWARLRDGGVTTAGRSSKAPYARQLSDAEFLNTMASGLAASKREVPLWRALGEASSERADRQPQALRLVATPAPTLSHR